MGRDRRCVGLDERVVLSLGGWTHRLQGHARYSPPLTCLSRCRLRLPPCPCRLRLLQIGDALFGLSRYSSHNTGTGVGQWTNWWAGGGVGGGEDRGCVGGRGGGSVGEEGCWYRGGRGGEAGAVSSEALEVGTAAGWGVGHGGCGPACGWTAMAARAPSCIAPAA